VPQCNALGTAFSISAGLPSCQFLIALAALNLMKAAPEEQQLLCVLEEA
jgi:hypothetical protein